MDKMNQEGIIKYKCIHNKSNSICHTQIADINLIRTLLFDNNLIGVDYSLDSNGIGFGNISKRCENINGHNNQFIISASGTGKNRILSADEYTLVTKCEIATNAIECVGIMPSSSESMSHYAIYEILPNINYVIHIHSSQIWDATKNILPATDDNSEYGTIEIAKNIQQVISTNKQVNNYKKNNCGEIVMSRHKDGLILFGNNLNELYKRILKMKTKFCS
jgi:ribulose-5-phosphate 4-epimerase/fuculose-1-phosphate aldolase